MLGGTVRDTLRINSQNVCGNYILQGKSSVRADYRYLDAAE